ncbi:transketolase [Amaricoccus sp.]|uniref:transketolase n=1 Tax=Amaricoccus sp. TaxID=1872485 RepID=UPI001B603D64|nr:transketolase [Amaricoccus sp.]MBP7000203.1 transketolase [Amaricoccus sp.]
MTDRRRIAPELEALSAKALWLACWMIHNANHLRPNPDGLKVGGHQASSASMVELMCGLYFRALRPEDRVAVKPHAGPVFHAIQYLLGAQTREKLEAFRGWGGAQSYPSRTKDSDDVDFSTGSVGLGVAITAFASLIQDYVRARGWAEGPEGRMIAFVGDAELDEGNIYECLQEGWKHGLRNCWWIIDYNRQSLDGVVREGLSGRIRGIFEAFGWDVLTLKYGALQRAAFEEPGGARLRAWIDACPNPLYSALTYQGGAAWRARLMDEIGDQGALTALLDRRSDAELARLMENLGGHCPETIAEAYDRAAADDRPKAILAYTVKGYGTPLAGHKDNHAGLMTPAQMAELQARLRVRPGHEWDRFEGLDLAPERLQAFLDAVPFAQGGKRRRRAERLPAPALAPPSEATTSTQAAFGRVMDALAKAGGPLADHVVTTSPDVTVSTNLGPWVNRRGLFARADIPDTFRDERIPSAQKWRFSPQGQHIELGIAEMNLFLLLGAAGLSQSLFGARLIPVGTLYDPFIARGLDALNYACYQDARFLLVATPSGVSLAGEGGAHQSIGTPLIGMSQDGIAAFEPAFADELSIVMDWAFDYLQRDAAGHADLTDERTWLRDESGGSVYLRLSTRQLEQPRRDPAAIRQGVIDGAYWLREPGPNCEVVLAYQGVLAAEAIAAAGMAAEGRRDVGVLAVTSADRLNAGWQAAQRARSRGRDATSHVERLLGRLPRHCTLITAIDGHPATLSWLGAVAGHRTAGLGVEHFGQTGTVTDLYRHYGVDRGSILAMIEALSPGRPLRAVGDGA